MGTDPPAGSKDDFLKAVLDGRYRVLEELGEGGMARVYLAEDLTLERQKVVVKRPLLREAQAARLLSAKGWGAEELRARFREEIRQLINVRHRGIVRILSQGVHGDTPYYVLEYMEAGSLQQTLDMGPQSTGEVLVWLGPVAEALDHMHAGVGKDGHKQPVVHRDVKPSNILFSRDGDRERACLSDFGIVKALGEEDTQQTLNTEIGTYAFMAPEQSDPTAVIDGRADQYALAATVYRALAGKDIFHDVPALDRPGWKKAHDPIRVDAEGMAAHLPKNAADAVMKALERNRDHRFPSCTAFAEAFEHGLRPETEVRGTSEAEGRPTVILHGQGEAGTTVLSRSRWIRALLVVGVLLAGAGYVTGVFDPGDRAARQAGETSDGGPPRAFNALAAEADKPPDWARVRPEQIEAAKRLGVRAWYENPIGMKFVLIPPGTFQMGSPDGEGDAEEHPQHEVEITKAFYLSIYETTNREYREFKGDHDSGDYEGVSLNGPEQPVVRVGQWGAAHFCDWLNAQDGSQRYRLPTEAEWEYACRAGTTWSRYWDGGDVEGHRYANGNDPRTKERFNGFAQYDGWQEDDGYRVTAPVGKFEPNAWGLYDTVGNVWEQCQDAYDEHYYEECKKDRSLRGDPRGPSLPTQEGPTKVWEPGDALPVLRGGCWGDDPGTLRSACRFSDDPSDQFGRIGFRVAVAVAPD